MIYDIFCITSISLFLEGVTLEEISCPEAFSEIAILKLQESIAKGKLSYQN